MIHLYIPTFADYFFINKYFCKQIDYKHKVDTQLHYKIKHLILFLKKQRDWNQGHS